MKEQSLALKVIDRLSLSLKTDDIGHIVDDDIVEIWNFDGVQLFRNFQFFKFISYSLEELLTLDFHQLFERDPAIAERLIGIFKQFTTAKDPKPIFPNIPEHLVVEKSSVEKRRFMVKYKAFLPLFEKKTNKAVAILVLYSMRFDDHLTHAPKAVGLFQPSYK